MERHTSSWTQFTLHFFEAAGLRTLIITSVKGHKISITTFNGDISMDTADEIFNIVLHFKKTIFWKIRRPICWILTEYFIWRKYLILSATKVQEAESKLSLGSNQPRFEWTRFTIWAKIIGPAFMPLLSLTWAFEHWNIHFPSRVFEHELGPILAHGCI